jgi:ABC-type arginine/histidine transport system permease subunit
MHQRYDYMVVILLVICVPLVKKEKSVMAIISMILFNAGNILTYSRSLFGDDYNPLFTFCCNAAAYFLFNYILWKSISEEKA